MMKFDFDKNFLKQSLGANLFSVSGIIFIVVMCVGLPLILDYGFGLLIVLGMFSYFHFCVSILYAVIFIIEVLFLHQLKNKFFTDNKIYSFIFYIGITLNLVVLYKLYIFMFDGNQSAH